MAATWWSAKLRITVFVEPEGATRHADSIVVFRAEQHDYDQALTRALAVGRGLQASYRNHDGQRVAWRLRRVVTLDQLGPADLDGREVYTEPAKLAPEEQVPFGAALFPELSEPGPTGVPVVEDDPDR